MTQINFDYMPDNPKNHYRNRNMEWQGWRNFYGNDFLSFEKARIFVRKLKLKNYKRWFEYCKSGKRPNNIPFAPNRTYKKEWISWGDFLGTGTICSRNRVFLSFEEAKIFVRKLKLKNKREWEKYYKSGKRPNNIPSCPDKIYRNKWKGWGDFLGTGNVRKKDFLSFKEARRFVRKLKLKNNEEWQKYSKSGNKPNNIPSNPYHTYKDEWTNWYDFLGTK